METGGYGDWELRERGKEGWRYFALFVSFLLVSVSMFLGGLWFALVRGGRYQSIEEMESRRFGGERIYGLSAEEVFHVSRLLTLNDMS